MSSHHLQRVLWHVRMEGHSLIPPAHVTVQMATVETPVKVSALHVVQQMTFFSFDHLFKSLWILSINCNYMPICYQWNAAGYGIIYIVQQ